jgi:hypothetical protein
MILVKGDRVRLTDAAIRCKTNRRHYVQWKHRHGTVVGATHRCIRIIWDGRTSIEFRSPHSIVLVLNGQ